MPPRYKGLNKREYDTFVRACDNVFDTRPIIYQLKLSKIQFVQSLLNGDPASQWDSERKRIREHGLVPHTWQIMKELLLEKVSPSQLRQLNISDQIKKLRQRPGQTVDQLVTYLDSLEGQ